MKERLEEATMQEGDRDRRLRIADLGRFDEGEDDADCECGIADCRGEG